MKQTLAVILGVGIWSASAAVGSVPASAAVQAPQTTPPAESSTPQSPPAEGTPSKAGQPAEPRKEESAAPAETPPETKNSPAPKTRRKKNGANPAAPKKRVIREGSTKEPTDQLAPGMSSDQASYSKQTTSQLLAAASANLKTAASRTLNNSQQAMVAQIRKFMEQSNDAVAAGDLQRGRNLAIKAHLLSSDLVKH